MPRRALLVLFLLVACATPKSARDGSDVSLRRMSVAAARARELPELPRLEVAPPQSAARGRVEAAGPLRYRKGEGATTVTVPLGTDSELVCFLYETPLDAAGALLSVARAVASTGELKTEAMRVTDVREVGGVPAIFLEVDYRTRLQGVVAVGQVKMMVRSAGTVPVLCAHDELGYAESFKRITTGLAVSLGAVDPERLPERFNEIHVVRLSGNPVGFSWRRVSDAKDRLRIVETTSSLLLPRDGSALQAQDSTQVLVSDAEGQTLQLSYAQAHDGALSLQLEAQRARPGLYQFVLTHEGKQLDGTFRARRGLTSELGVLPQLRAQVLSGREERLSVDVYQPALDPLGPVEAVYAREGGGQGAVTLTVGASKVRGTVDAQGVLERSEVAMDASTLTSERIFLQGAL
ncbi:MAG: hypothetical protein L0Y66_17695 [Myxococcaceae bacterium]|nr:hypothetical protein [Myxococcaceae bacterium]MCI0670214.1 hypothetical protein [Myxococcaceae bacterium]